MSPRSTSRAAFVPHTVRLRALAGAGLLGAALLAAGPALAQTATVPQATPGAGDTPPEVVKPRTAGPGDRAAGVIHPGVTGDSAMHVAPPSGRTFQTPVIKPQTMQGDRTAVVPK